VKGSFEEVFKDGQVLKVNVDSLVRNGNEAIVGGVVKQLPSHVDGLMMNHRAYIKVIDNSGDDGLSDFVSKVAFEVRGQNPTFQLGEEYNVNDARVSVCSKHGDWEGCLERMKTE
jgi:hypothetical protein